ncbi:hypothetical protein Hanom_Chr15g01363561 [Helianthus anomalus]
MFVCLSKMFMCKFFISNMLHPKSGKSKRGEYEYTHNIAISSDYPIVDECMRLGGWNTEVTLCGQTMVHE